MARNGTTKSFLIQESLRNMFLDGAIKPGEAIPSEGELAKKHGVTRHTVREALYCLKAEGLLRSRQGAGYFLCIPSPANQREPGRPGSRVGILLHDISSPMISQMLGIMERIVSDRGYQLTMVSYDPASGQEPNKLVELASRGISALIAFPSYNSQSTWYGFTEVSSIPLVLVDNCISDMNVDTVTADNFDGGYRGALALIKAGARKIAFVSGYLSAWSSRERLMGFRKAIWMNGLPDEPELVVDGPFSKDFGYQSVSRILSQNNDVDSFFIANDPITEGALLRFKELGINIPNQIRVCSFDDVDSYLGKLFEIIIVRQPISEVARTAANLAIDKIEGKTGRGPPPSHVRIKPEIIIPGRLLRPAKRSTPR